MSRPRVFEQVEKRKKVNDPSKVVAAPVYTPMQMQPLKVAAAFRQAEMDAFRAIPSYVPKLMVIA